MMAFIIKSSISLGILYACYYFFFRKDKRFLFNRFYLLGAVLLSLAVPFVTLPPPFQHAYFDDSHLPFAEGGIQIIRTGETTLNGEFRATGAEDHAVEFIFFFMYIAGVLIMAFRYLKNLFTIRRLIVTSEKHVLNDGICLVLVNGPVSPFSFGRYVFVDKEACYNEQIDEDILLHEEVHVRHRHSIDNLFLECLLVVYWFNPLLWCYRFALRASHEYCADHIVASKSGIVAYCHRLIEFTSQRYHPLPGSGFKHSLIKNRILMMNRTKSSLLNFSNKLAVTGIAVLITLLALSFKNVPSGGPQAPGDAGFTVVIDAGHGGADRGAQNDAKTILEKDLVLAIAGAMKAVDKDPSIRFIYTRSGDEMVSLEDRVRVGKKNQADLFLSLHVNAHEEESANGLEVYYSEQNAKHDLSARYSSMFASGIKLLEGSPSVVKKANFIVLRENDCPAVLLNVGYITNKKESSLLSSKENQQKLAAGIVKIISEISKM